MPTICYFTYMRKLSEYKIGSKYLLGDFTYYVFTVYFIRTYIRPNILPRDQLENILPTFPVQYRQRVYSNYSKVEMYLLKIKLCRPVEPQVMICIFFFFSLNRKCYVPDTIMRVINRKQISRPTSSTNVIVLMLFFCIKKS